MFNDNVQRFIRCLQLILGLFRVYLVWTKIHEIPWYSPFTCKAYHLNDQRSANKSSVGQISICSGSGLQGDDFRAPGSTAKNIQGSRNRNDWAPGSTAKISWLGLQAVQGRPFSGTLDHDPSPGIIREKWGKGDAERKTENLSAVVQHCIALYIVAICIVYFIACCIAPCIANGIVHCIAHCIIHCIAHCIMHCIVHCIVKYCMV